MAKRGYESQKTGQKVDDLLDKIDNLNVPEWALQESKPSYTAQDVHALPENTSIPKKTSDLVNDRGFITQESDPTVPSWAKQPSKPTYTAEEVGALSEDTPIFSGDYNDLRNKPTIPTVPTDVSAFNNDAGYLTQHQDISGKEDKSNKVTSLSVQNTDTQYPSAKAVFDNLSTKQDTINDLASIRSGASAGATAYQKPQAGIPESDLSQGVKDKLNEKEVFWATYGTTTAQEIIQAHQNGKDCLVYKNNKVYRLTKISDTTIDFYEANDAVQYFVRVDRATNNWVSANFSLEKSTYKKTTITGNESSTTYYPSTKAVADYAQKKMEIVAASGTTLNSAISTYYNFASEVGTLDITFPAVTDTTHIGNIVFMLTTGSTPAVTFTAPSGINVIAQDGFSIEASTTYEINAIFNGTMWVVAAMKLNTTDIQTSNP